MRHASLRTQLAEVKSLLQTMCDRVYGALTVLRKHVASPGSDELMKVILLDNEVDRLEKTIDEKILYIFATQQPLGQELREAYASVKIAHQIERIGDAVESLARQLSSGAAQALDQGRLIDKMLDSSMQLFRMSYRAMFENEFGPVVDIYVKDDEVDALHRSLFREAKSILARPVSSSEVDSALQLINISNKLEKIADISCNWAEQIDFLMHGMHRRRILRRPQRVILADSHGGMLAALVASHISKSPGIAHDPSHGNQGIDFSLATTASHTPMVSFAAATTSQLAAHGWVVEPLPVSQLESLNWDRVLLAIYLGSSLGKSAKASRKAQPGPGHKVVDVFWPEIDMSENLMHSLTNENREPSGDEISKPSELDSTELLNLIGRIETKSTSLVELLNRMQKPR